MNGILGRPEVTVWHSKDGGPWNKIRISAHSPLVAWLEERRPGEIYEDGYGNAYADTRLDPVNPEEIPDER
jgi:hypothetical protein